jgi:hypothetical protein
MEIICFAGGVSSGNKTSQIGSITDRKLGVGNGTLHEFAESLRLCWFEPSSKLSDN